MLIFHLDWRRCLDGYQIERRERKPGRGARILDDSGDYIVRNSGRLESTTPMQCGGLWKQLTECWIADNALGFVTRFGFLNRRNGREQRVDDILNDAETMRDWDRSIAWQDWPAISKALDSAGEDSLFEIGGVGRLGLLIHHQDGTERPELRLRPGSLFQAILVQAIDNAIDGTPLKKCFNPACSEWFRYGPGTNHRNTAMYHSPTCKGAHAYAKLKEARKEARK